MGQNTGNLLEGPIKALYRKYLFPSISATLVTSIYILADTMMIGRGVGRTKKAAEQVAAYNGILKLKAGESCI
jgi:Na+-driven multidrug efflux pump